MRLTNLIPFSTKDTSFYRDPFKALREQIDSLFERNYNDLSPLLSSSRILNLDVCDKGEELIISTEVPGVSEKDLSININNGILTINGEKKMEKKEDKDSYYLMERSYGSFSRSLQLPFQADPDQIKAKLQDGVLTVSVKKPKEVAESSRRIKIESK
jgi:HSP20 family protein